MSGSYAFTGEGNFFEERKKQKSDGYMIEPHNIKFDSNDSSASDVSYESSISSNQEKQKDKIQYFREQMSRFFINYPQLLNDEIVENETNEKNLWGDLTQDILNEARETPISLQAIAKRIAYYRRKCEEIDIIDLLIKQKDTILQELEAENDMLLQQNITTTKKTDDMNRNENENENVYYSWKKRRQNDIITNSRKNSKRSNSSFHKTFYLQKKTVNSLHKNKQNVSAPKRKDTMTVANQKFSLLHHFNEKTKEKKYSRDIDTIQEQKTSSFLPSQAKALFNFEPKTEIGKQLCQEIKQNNPNDALGIKKTIINFLAKHRESIQKDIMNKSTLSQKINKLYIEDSKELLLFYPIKKPYKQTQMPLKVETDQFLSTLKEITEGPIMKYWKILQEKKI